MKNVMRKLILLTMTGVMLFMSVPMRAAAACDHCNHTLIKCSGKKVRIINGYTHSYTTKHGGSAGCGFARTISYKIRDEHRTNHDQ